MSEKPGYVSIPKPHAVCLRVIMSQPKFTELIKKLNEEKDGSVSIFNYENLMDQLKDQLEHQLK